MKPRRMQPCFTAKASDLAAMTLLASTMEHNVKEMREALERQERISNMLAALRAKINRQYK